MAPKGAPIVALVGAPNAGKSTLFNSLTGAKARMGNWPGTTVEVSRGAWKQSKDVTYDVIDFPGAYSLDPMSPDEELTRNLVIDAAEQDRPDLVIIAVDASSLSRSLYMVAQLTEQENRLVVVMTKADVAAANGEEIDSKKLSEQLGIPVVSVDPRHRSNVEKIGAIVAEELQKPKKVHRAVPADASEFDLADRRFEWVESAVHASTTIKEASKTTLNEKIDRLALNPIIGPLMFLATMWLVFQITTTVASPLQDAPGHRLDQCVPDRYSFRSSDCHRPARGWSHQRRGQGAIVCPAHGAHVLVPRSAGGFRLYGPRCRGDRPGDEVHWPAW